ncbi:hypothetical protein ACJJTC_010696 [Scirpophaga incertulas]
MSERDHFILRIIAEWIQPLQIQAQDEVCLPCWLRAQRVAINHQEQDIDMVQAEPSNSETVRQDSSETINQQEQDIDMVQAGPSNNETVRQISSEASPEENVQEDNPVQTQSSGSLITLPSIRRAAATASRCIFTECDDHEKLNVPESIRRRILIDFNFYIPINARICLFHLGSNLFHELYSAQNSLNTFTAEYIEDMVFLLREVKQFDFNTWNTPGTSSQPTVALPPPPAQPLPPTVASADTQWKPPKKKQKIAEDSIIKIFKECEGTASRGRKPGYRISKIPEYRAKFRSN